MVFRKHTDDYWETFLFCGTYHPYRRFGEKNPNFDVYSGLILDLKENKGRAVERRKAATVLARGNVLQRADRFCALLGHRRLRRTRVSGLAASVSALA